MEDKDGVIFLFRRNLSIIREQEKGDMTHDNNNKKC